jgi:hypothetical protein
VLPDLGSSNHQPLPPEGGKMTKNEIVTDFSLVRACASYDSAVYLVCVLWALRAHVNLFVYLFLGI